MTHYIEFDPSTGNWHEIDPLKRADLVAVVRCRDCTRADWYGAAGVGMFRCAVHGWTGDNSDGFCAWGERKDGAE